MRNPRRARLKKPRELHLAAWLALTLLGLPSPALAGKVDVGFGFFSLSARSGGRTIGSLQNLGSYRVGYRQPMGSHFELGVGYSLIMSRIIGGDLAFGLDVSASYYPLTQNSEVQWSAQGKSFNITELWRPYFSVSIHQREFQSVQIGYAGFGGALGVERWLSGPWHLHSEARCVVLFGAKETSATEIDLTLGLSFQY